jgi:hypothetical protein
MPGSLGRPAFNALHWMRGKLALAKFQLSAKMEVSGVAGRPPKFPIGASLAFLNWRAA